MKKNRPMSIARRIIQKVLSVAFLSQTLNLQKEPNFKGKLINLIDSEVSARKLLIREKIDVNVQSQKDITNNCLCKRRASLSSEADIDQK